MSKHRKTTPQEVRDDAREELRSVGGQDMPVATYEVDEAIDAFELAVLRLVMANSSISGNASDYVLGRIKELEGQR
ncbi:hypothetical protein [Streptomyces sp. NPDC006631]|uniref:hypothetical protein n=1 Tax=Streptomyces sp. NPDC006631 TaxID=3364752 RepID=UPI0036AD42B9